MFFSQKERGPAEDFIPQTEILMQNLLVPGLHKAPYHASENIVSIMHAQIWNESDVYLKVKESCDDIKVPQIMIIKIDQRIVTTNKVRKFLAVTFVL